MKKSLERFFHKVQKTAKNGKKLPKMPILAKSAIFTKKKGHATFEPLWMPNFMPSFRKILRAFFEKSRYERTDGRTDKSNSIGPVGLQPGTKKVSHFSRHPNVCYPFFFKL